MRAHLKTSRQVPLLRSRFVETRFLHAGTRQTVTPQKCGWERLGWSQAESESDENAKPKQSTLPRGGRPESHC